MRRRPAYGSGEAVDPEPGDPPVGETGGPVPAPQPVFPAGEDRQPLVDIAVDRVELPPGVPVAEVRTPASQHGVEVGDHGGYRPLGLRDGSGCTDFVPQ